MPSCFLCQWLKVYKLYFSVTVKMFHYMLRYGVKFPALSSNIFKKSNLVPDSESLYFVFHSCDITKLRWLLSQSTQDVNWTHIGRSEDVLDVFWTSYVRSIYVLCRLGWLFINFCWFCIDNYFSYSQVSFYEA